MNIYSTVSRDFEDIECHYDDEDGEAVIYRIEMKGVDVTDEFEKEEIEELEYEIVNGNSEKALIMSMDETNLFYE